MYSKISKLFVLCCCAGVKGLMMSLYSIIQSQNGCSVESSNTQIKMWCSAKNMSLGGILRARCSETEDIN